MLTCVSYLIPKPQFTDESFLCWLWQHQAKDKFLLFCSAGLILQEVQNEPQTVLAILLESKWEFPKVEAPQPPTPYRRIPIALELFKHSGNSQMHLLGQSSSDPRKGSRPAEVGSRCSILFRQRCSKHTGTPQCTSTDSLTVSISWYLGCPKGQLRCAGSVEGLGA